MKKSLMIAGVVAVTGQLIGGLMPVRPAFADDQLSVVSMGGRYQMAQRKAYFEPYAEQTGVKITEDEYLDEPAKVRAMVETKSVTWDVIVTDLSYAITLCNEGIIEPIDWKKIGLDRAKFMEGDKSDCGVPTDVYSEVVAYDKDKLPNGPESIADLFDLQKFPGKRGLFKDPWGNLEWALMADGVPIKDVYKVLRTPEGVDRAFKKLDTIKKDVVWFVSFAQPLQLLADGQVVMTTSGNGRISDANKNDGKHFAIMWDAQRLGVNVWAMPKGTSRLEDAHKFIAFAASPQAQANFSGNMPYGPANKDAVALVDPAVLPDLPTAPENMANAMMMDLNFWADNGDALRQRFTAWLAK
ncbi:polyamine ABC transporter substrate-binding protein [Mesorhizobium sp. M0698]|uniref:polyamine ABC transporter substrate-binding protein n=1 Tax=Mesorhizobium sp. M0698 TaxID=2956987 RepID=UPI003338C912